MSKLHDQKVMRIECFDARQCHTSANRKTMAALAIYLPGRVLAIHSRLRMAHHHPASGLHFREMEQHMWSLERSRWLTCIAREGRTGDAMVQQYDAKLPGMDMPFRVGWHLSGIETDIENREALSLRFDEANEPLAINYLPSLDGAIGWTGSRQHTPARPTRDWADHCPWMDPSANIPILWNGQTLSSAKFQHWPLPLRKQLLGEAINYPGSNTLTHEKLMGSEDWSAAYQKILDQLIQLREAQHPWIRQRRAHQNNCHTKQPRVINR